MLKGGSSRYDMSIIIYLFEFQLPICSLNPEFLNFEKEIAVLFPLLKLEVVNAIFFKHQRFLIATENFKYLLIFVLHICLCYIV
jgi:hypothetical protein